MKLVKEYYFFPISSKVKPDTVITVQEFNERVEKGEMLAVLDEYVLDLKKYINEHPGGRFSLE